MDAANRTPTTKQLPALGADEKPRRWSVQERREIVEETLAPGGVGGAGGAGARGQRQPGVPLAHALSPWAVGWSSDGHRAGGGGGLPSGGRSAADARGETGGD